MSKTFRRDRDHDYEDDNRRDVRQARELSKRRHRDRRQHKEVADDQD